MSEDHSNTSQDSEEKLTEFEKLVRVCKNVLQVFKQTEFQQAKAKEQNGITSSLHCSVPPEIRSASLSKVKPQGIVSSGDTVVKRSCTTTGGESSSRSSKYSGRKVVEHDYLNDKKASSDFRKFNENNSYMDDRDDEKGYLDLNGKRKLRCYDDDEDPDYSEKKRLCNNIMAKNKYVEVASLPLTFNNRMREMGGDDVKLVIQKHMFSADISRGQNRFSIPVNQVREDAKDFLTEEEISRVPMEVPLIEPNLNLTRIVIRKWKYSGKSSSYALSGPWSAIRRGNDLQLGMEMQLWSFRVNGDLNLALVKVLRDNKQDHGVHGSARTSQMDAESRDQLQAIAQIKSRNEADRDGGQVARDAAGAAAAILTQEQMEDIDLD